MYNYIQIYNIVYTTRIPGNHDEYEINLRPAREDSSYESRIHEKLPLIDILSNLKS